MSGQDYAQAWAFVAALAGDPNVAVMDWRALHDTDKTVPGHARRGTLPEWWQWLCQHNDAGYGIFCTIAAMDGAGRDLANVAHIRAHYTDNDNLSAQQNYERAAAWTPAPSFAVQTSPGKFHTYWVVEPYSGNDYFQLIQRKLRQLFDGDRAVIDAARVMRVPGTFHRKGEPFLVRCWSLPGYGAAIPVATLDAALVHVNVIDGASGMRHELGDPDLSAPSLEWIHHALALSDPNTLSRGDWIALTSAIKQAGWLHADPDTLFNIWSEWCAKYTAGEGNNPGENIKQWASIRQTELGWPSILKRVPGLLAAKALGGIDRTGALPGGVVAAPPMPDTSALDCSGEFLTHIEQQEWFKGCIAVERSGEILTPTGRFMNASKFNLKYGGKQFIISAAGKLTDEPWKAATRSTLWTVPKVDHVRFLPDRPFGEIVHDQLGRRGVNTYMPINIRHMPGDVTPFTRHIELMLPNEADRNVLYAYLAHNVKYPGVKIPWAPLIQSTEGVGKGFIMETMETIIGEMYCYSPKAQELVKSGATFNAWMRAKLMIIVNEIKVDERRELIEILKPMITDRRVEIQSKGIDQEMEDNPANWVFFSNFKDAIPVAENGRRYAIFYSVIQSKADLLARGMDDLYFIRLFAWLRADGAAIVADWFMRHPITADTMPMVAPETSSMTEARAISRSPLERMILEAVEDGLPGFRGAWVSTVGVAKRIKETGAVRGTVAPQTIERVLEGMGYVDCGRAPRAYFAESTTRSTLFHRGGLADVAGYAGAQGW